MKWKTATGRFKDIPMHKYVIDWDDAQDSKESKRLAEFLRPYWKYDVVCVQVPVAGTPRYSYDYVNISKKIVIEYDGKQHDKLILGFYHRTREDFKNQIKRDVLKDQLAELNGFKMVRVKPEDLDKLSPAWFKEQFDVIL